MKLLPVDFEGRGTQKGYSYHQLARTPKTALYVVRRGNLTVGYEVIKIQSHNGREMFGKFIPPSEYYPSSQQWGVCGFSCDNKDRALIKYHQLTQTA